MNHDNYLVVLEQKINRAFTFLEEHITTTLALLFTVALSLRLALTPFGLVLREDAYIYVLKSIEITKGNFTPILTQPMGWSLFMAPFFYFFKSSSIFSNMVYARIISDVVASFMVFPIYWVGKFTLKKEELVYALILFTFSSQLIISATSAMTEPLFISLFLTSLYFVYRSLEKQPYILLASFFGGLAYYVRTNGIFVLVIILISFWILRKNIRDFDYKYFLYILVFFFLTAAPHLYQRYVQFGSPTFYGPNSKFFSDTQAMVWSNNIPVPSFLDYLRTHTLLQCIERFVIHGFFELVFLDFFYKTTSVLLTFPFLYGVLIRFKDKKFMPLFVTFLVWIIGLTPVWAVFDNPRHLCALVPFVLMFTAVAILNMFETHQNRTLLNTLFLAIFIAFSLVTPIKNRVEAKNSYVVDGIKWAKWAAKNIRGKIAIIEGGDLIMMNLPDTTVGGVGMYDLYAPETGLSIVRPGYFKKLVPAMKWLKKIGATHIAVDEMNIHRRPYLNEIMSAKRIPSYLTEIFSNFSTDSKWKIRIYSIDWAKFRDLSLKYNPGDQRKHSTTHIFMHKASGS